MQIVALHGQMGMKSDWDSLACHLGDAGHDLVAVDLWRYLSKSEISLESFGDKLNAEQDEDEGEVLLGYSMGGRLALHSLITQQNKWKAAVIISAHIGLKIEERKLRRRMDDEWADKLEGLPWLEFLQDWNKQGVLGNVVMPDRSGLEARKTEVARSFRCWSLAEQEDLLEKLSNIEIPVLWVVGENDEKFCKQGEMAVSVMRNAKLLKIPNVGHRVPWEGEDELTRAIDRWIKTLE